MGTTTAPALFAVMTATTKGTQRALKLKTQSDNCLTIAIGERDGDAAAMLIDEAAKLALRARARQDRLSAPASRKIGYPSPKQA